MQGMNLKKPRWMAAARMIRPSRQLGEHRPGLFEQIAVKTGAAAGLLMLAATSPAATLADCDAATHARTLHPAVTTGLRANAAWIDATRLRWAGVAGSGRYRLHHSATAAISARSGASVSGADWSIELTPASSALGKAEQLRWAWLGTGTDLVLPAAEASRLAAGLRGQLLLTREDSAGRVLAVTQIQHPGALDALYSAALSAPMPGATPTAAGGSFRLWAPTAQAVSVCLYADGRAAARGVHALTRDEATGFWTATLPEAIAGHAFLYLVDVAVPNVGIVRNRVTDPYALALSTDSARSYLIDLADPATKPTGWDATPRPDTVRDATDLVIYELHVRDFSVQDATVQPARRGKYLAFTEAASDGVEHLQRLAEAGITDVHLLPAYDLSTVPEAGCETPTVSGAADAESQQAAIGAVRERDCFNWGYDPWHYTVPEGSYSSDPESPSARIREFRAMVQALHRRGLRVGMDVVYNHTFAAGQDAKSVLDRIVPGYYHRLNADGGIERSTCCENTATEHAMMARLMIDSAVIWARDYRIDSFRFDLMGHQPRAAMEQLQAAVNTAAGRHIHLIGEGWNFGEVADGRRFVQAAQLALAGSGIGTFSDRARDAARGGSPGDSGRALVARQGWLSGLHYLPNAESGPGSRAELLAAADLVRVGLAGTLRDYRMRAADGQTRRLEELRYGNSPAGYVHAPGEVVNYVENHDNQTLYDGLVMKLPRATPMAERVRIQALGNAIVAFSQGIAYLHAGQEILRSKSLDRNSYNSGDHFNPLDLSLTDNGYGRGLPPAWDNQSSWPWMRPLLADPNLKPAPEHIRHARDLVLDLFRIRQSSKLFRLPDTRSIQRRLTLLNTGPEQIPTVLVGHLDGRDLVDAGFPELVYAINVAPTAAVLNLPTLAGRAWQLHPVHLRDGAADPRPREAAAVDVEAGRFSVPPRTALVWVVMPG
jgi:pullulanase/glycogen debranching enzyme